MKVLFAVSNEEVSENIVKRYQREYKEIISYKNVYYFNAILKELQKDKTYDRVVISEDLESFTHNQYDQIDKFIFEKLDSISDEASNFKGDDIPIILICSDRRTKSEQMLVKLFGIGIYNALLGPDRTVEELCKLINKPRLKKEGKTYYKIDVDDVKYKAENENDVSEVEIQNILAHYKRLGKNEEKYLESFENIAAQYNDTQLRIIAKFLPLNVRAVLEEKSSKYQRVMSFNAKVSNELRKKSKDEKIEGTTEKLLKTSNMRETVLSNPVVIPGTMNLEKGKKMTRPRTEKPLQPQMPPQVKVTPQPITKPEPEPIQSQIEEPETMKLEVEEVEKVQPEITQPVKRGRGRPRKNPVVPENTGTEQVKKKRGRPKKVIEEPENEEVFMPGFETVEPQEETTLPRPELETQSEPNEDTMMPGFEDFRNEEAILPGFEEEPQEEIQTPRFEEEPQEVSLPGFEIQNELEEQNMPRYEEIQAPKMEKTIEKIEEPEMEIDISQLLQNKKIACFVGTSKNGTSFVVNHIAEVLSLAGVSTAILDTTQNKNSYYIYTKNDETLRNIAANCIDNLIMGQAKGVQANKNLTIYTPVPGEENQIRKAGEILQTLVQNHSVVLIDCDFETPVCYFSYAQEIYLIQSLDILTIQPLTAFLNELKARGVLEENKLRIVLNKFEKLKGITDKIIIGGMSSYNDPSMSYMIDLFDKNLIKYIAIPFDEQVYVKYLEGIINCELSLKGYPKNIVQILTELGNMIYPIDIGKGKPKGKSTYTPPTLSNNSGFTPSINSTLEQMRKY